MEGVQGRLRELLRPAQLLPHEGLLGDVLDRADHPRRGAVGAQHELVDVAHEAHTTVGPADAVLEDALGARRDHVLLDLVSNRIPVVRMDRRDEIVEFPDTDTLDPIALFGCRHLVARDVPLPAAQVGDALRLGEIGFTAQALGSDRLVADGCDDHLAQHLQALDEPVGPGPFPAAADDGQYLPDLPVHLQWDVQTGAGTPAFD